MSGLSPLVDTLLASRLAQRVDLVPLKPEVQIAGPGPITGVEEIINDVRLPSRAAVEHQIGVGLLKSGQRGHGSVAAQSDQAVILSPVARAVSTILEGQIGAAARVIGSEPLLAPSQPLSPSVIAATLARTVSQSGLFYESHLAQFVAGTRSLDELEQEPQARLQGSLKTEPASPGSPGGASSGGLDTHESMHSTYSRIALPVALNSNDAEQAATGQPRLATVLPEAPETDSGRFASTSDTARAHKNAYASIQNADSPAPSAKNHAENMAGTERGNPPALAGIHPDAVALVRQQLELLAQPAFRWCGEAWPDVPMEWDVREDEAEPANGAEAAPRIWSTRLALTLPTLRNVEVRISLAGNALQVHLAAAQDTTRDLLHQARTELPGELRALGLELTELQIGSLAEPAPAHKPEASDGA